MSLFKKIILASGVVFIAIQFIQPARNKSGHALPTGFAKLNPINANVDGVLQSSCYDCHSNNTTYPWYSNIQPMAWIMARHIKNGKEKFNFSDFSSSSTRRQINKLKEIANQIKDDEMPVASYRAMQKKAILSKEKKNNHRLDEQNCKQPFCK